jgi:hyperosmotically inducible periplasmic protein
VNVRAGLAGIAVAAALALSAGCSRLPDRSHIGGFVDDAAITSTVKTRMVENKTVDADAIQVETHNGNVVLSGTARNPLEKDTAESIAMKVVGVKSVQNNLALRP